MRFLLDENAEYRIARWLRQQGHDVTAIAVDYPPSLSDTDIVALALAERRIIVTNDTDFGELVFAQKRTHAGVILFRRVMLTQLEHAPASLKPLRSSDRISPTSS